MAVREFYVSLKPTEAMDIITEAVVGGSMTGQIIDEYERSVGDYKVYVFILEKYYMRSSNRASLTVTLDNFDGKTKVHVVASGSGEGAFLRFDWGAGKSFSASVENALAHYIV